VSATVTNQRKARPCERRLGLGPVVEIMRRREGSDPRHDGMSQGDLAKRIGVDTRMVSRWFAEGSLPVTFADIVALEFGYHGENLWPGEFLGEPFTEYEARETG